MSSFSQRIALLEASKHKENSKQITIENGSLIIHAKDQDKIYIPTTTGGRAHSDNSFVRIIMGPYGSGKSTWAVTEIVKRACNIPKWYAGRRRSRWGIVRNTSGELQSTTLATWLSWFDELGDVRKRQKPILTYEHTFNDGNGIVELELLFIALDRPEDVRKIKSLELTGCYINELSEVPKAALAHMKGRVNRYPSKAFCNEPYWSGIIADTNPPSNSSWLFEDFELNCPSDHVLFKQPPALLKNDDDEWIRNPDADNAAHLPEDYYLRLASGQSKEFIKVYCLGEWGTVSFGKVVFPEFNSDIHATNEIESIQGESIHLGWDGGLTPACIVVQMSERGQLRVLKEYVAQDIGLRSFAESIVIPGLKRDFPYNHIGLSVFDPAGSARDMIVDEMSCISELNDLGINTQAASTNKIEPRLASVRFFLNKMADGKPSFLLSKKKCPKLYEAFLKDYIYRKLMVIGEERYKPEPEKNSSSHISDALQYICLEMASDNIAKSKQKDKPVDMYNPVFRWS